MPWGGLRYDEPSLKCRVRGRHPGGRVARHRPAGQPGRRRRARWRSTWPTPRTPLQVTLSYRVYDGFDVLERWATMRNAWRRPAGRDPAGPLGQLVAAGRAALAAALPARRLGRGDPARRDLAQPRQAGAGEPARHHRATSSTPGSRWTRTARRPRTSGEVWSGGAGVERLVEDRLETTPAGRVHACGGWNDFDWAHRLAPGEELVLPGSPACTPAAGSARPAGSGTRGSAPTCSARGDDVARPARARAAPHPRASASPAASAHPPHRAAPAARRAAEAAAAPGAVQLLGGHRVRGERGRAGPAGRAGRAARRRVLRDRRRLVRRAATTTGRASATGRSTRRSSRAAWPR